MSFEWTAILVPLSIILMVVYAVCLILIFLYALSQLSLLLNYIRQKNKTGQDPVFDLKNPKEVPFVTIQLPIYNELYVIERLLDYVSEIEYPQEKIEVQVLDDSTDESVLITAKKIAALCAAGHNIIHVRRSNREGFKAGALKEGLKSAKGEFVAIFDADFTPKKDWLLQTIPYFKNEKIGVVQTTPNLVLTSCRIFNPSSIPMPRLPLIDDLLALSKLALKSKGTFNCSHSLTTCSAIIIAWSRDSI